MPSQLASATWQAVLLTACSNVFAQAMQVYSKKSLSAIDTAAFLHFTIFALLATPPNFAFQQFLEESFPTRTTGQKPLPPAQKSAKSKDGAEPVPAAGTEQESKASFSVTNTVIKFVLDQSLAAPTNTLAFIAVIGAFKGLGTGEIVARVSQDFWPMLSAGFKLWPLVCLLNLIVVPFEYRMLVGNLAAFGWGVFISLRNF